MSRPKTPSISRPKTPSISRPKTPSFSRRTTISTIRSTTSPLEPKPEPTTSSPESAETTPDPILPNPQPPKLDPDALALSWKKAKDYDSQRLLLFSQLCYNLELQRHVISEDTVLDMAKKSKEFVRLAFEWAGESEGREKGVEEQLRFVDGQMMAMQALKKRKKRW